MNIAWVFFQPMLTLFLVLAACSDPPSPTVGRSLNKAASEQPAAELSDADLQKLYLSFESTLKPLMKERCLSCHTEVGSGIGPNTIYQHVAMVNLAKAGKSSQDNKLINKLLNKISHGGGSQCASIEKSPCAEVVAWSKQLYRSKGSVETSTVKTPANANSSSTPPTGSNAQTLPQTPQVDQTANSLAALESEYNSGLKGIIDQSCNGSNCHSTRTSNLTSFQGVKKYASESQRRLNSGNMPLGRSISSADKAKLVTFLGKLSS